MADVHDRVAAVEENLDRLLTTPRPDADGPVLDPSDEVVPGTSLTARAAVELFEDMVRSRVLDVVGREMKSRGEGFYTISSAGHEFNAMVGALTRPTDPALLHYRSGGFYMARERRAAAESGEPRNPVRDTLASLAASANDPVARGRHKVWGSRQDWMIPQTSTIGSHPPKATGTAFAIDLARRIGHELEIPSDSIVVCSFGDASANHATTMAGINAARYSKRLGAPTPILFVCEDNGLGISVPTPRGWIEDSYGNLKHLRYVRADGDVGDVWAAVEDAVAITRDRRMPVFLHLSTVRLWGHAGSDVEAGYRSREDIRRDEAGDPLLRFAEFLLDRRVATQETLKGIVGWTRTQARALAVEVGTEPHLATAREVMDALGGTDGDLARGEAERIASVEVAPDARREAFADHLPEDATQPVKRTMAAHINAALTDELLRRPEAIVLGEDVGRKGGVYGVTSGLQRAFGQHRVFDTLLDETTVLGTAQGAATLGMLPIPEIQYLAYLHNAIDQLRGEAASLSFFSDGQYTNPMVIRVAGLAYQRGFGGHFHNDNALGALREIPGIVLAVPSRGDDAAMMLRGATSVARALGRVVVFVEPIALYHQRDLHREGDGGWLTDYPDPSQVIFPGEVGIHDEPGRAGQPALLVLSYGNGVLMSRRVAKRLADEHGVNVRVMDVRWLLPFAATLVKAHADACQHVLVVDEGRAAAGIGDSMVASLVERGYRGRIAAVRSRDSFVPLGPAADAVLLQEADIHTAALEVCGLPQVPVDHAAAAPTPPVDPEPLAEAAPQEPSPVEPDPEAVDDVAAAEHGAPLEEHGSPVSETDLPDPEEAEVSPTVAEEWSPPTAEEPVVEEPVVEEPVSEEPVVVEPLADEPVVEHAPQEPSPVEAGEQVAEAGHEDTAPGSGAGEVGTSALAAELTALHRSPDAGSATPGAGTEDAAPAPRPAPAPFIVDPRTRPGQPVQGWHEEPSTDDASAAGPVVEPPRQSGTSSDDGLFTAKGGRPRRRGR